MQEPAKGTQFARFGAFEVNFASGELRKHGIRLKVQEQPFQVLELLLARPGELVTRETIQQKLWPFGTFVDFENGLNTAINRLREALGDSAENSRFIVTEPRRGYRFIAPVDDSRKQPEETAPSIGSRIKWLVIASFACIGALAIAGNSYFHRVPKLTDKDMIVLADFTNSTGDTVFDNTLRQGLSVQLQQSPFLSIVSDYQIQQTLRMMGQKPDAKLTPGIAGDLCQRTGSAAVLDGTIAQIGSHYNLIFKVTRCGSGDLIASTEAEASDKSHIFDALGRAASEMRNKLGESLSSVESLNTPLEQATTSSLEALQAYTLGRKQAEKGSLDDALLFFKRAIELDPNFALAYAGLGSYYANQDDDLSTQYATRAFDLRSHVSERERLYIDTVYYETVTGELDKEVGTLKVMQQTYPRDPWAHRHLGFAYERAGELAQAAAEYRAAISLNPQRPQNRYHLGAVLLRLGSLDESKSIFEGTIADKIDNIDVHVGLYRIAYARRDAQGMQREVEWAAGKPDEFRMLWEQGEIALQEGRLERARELWRNSNDLSARRNQHPKIPLGTSRLARFGVLLGDCRGVGEHKPSMEDAFALALCGHTKQANELIREARTRFPKDTLIQAIRVPMASAAIAINKSNPDAAIEFLRSAAPYENGYPGVIYVRGLAYLRAHRAAEAAAEFQRILHGTELSEPFGALSYLGLARAYVLQGDTSKAKAAYQDFLTLWKDADPDIPILKEAKAEYAKLQVAPG